MTTRKPLLPRQDDDYMREGGRCLAWRKALVCIDMQYLSCQDGSGVFADPEATGLDEKALDAYLHRLEDTVLPNVKLLQETFRQNEDEIIHVRIQSLTRDGRDRSPEHKALGLHAPPGSRLAKFLPRVAPQADEIVINKTASGVFVATNLEFVLRNLCVSEVIVTGVFTNECISSAVRSASDLGFDAILVSDATAAPSRALHEATLEITHDRYATVMPTQEVIALMNARARDEVMII